MKKIVALLCSMVMLFGVTAFASSQEPRVLKLASDQNEEYLTSDAVKYFCQRVEEISEGALKVEAYFNAVLGDEKSAIEQAQYGGIDILRVNTPPLCEFCPSFNALAFPFIYADADHFWRVMDSDVGKDILHSEEMENAGLYGLTYLDNGSRNFFFSKVQAHTPEDLKNLNIRTQESALMIGMVKALGANPIAMTAAEQYSALQNGVIDGAENNIPYYLSMAYNEVAPYIVLDEHTRVPDTIVMSTIVKDSLSDEEMSWLQQAADETSQFQRDLWAADEQKSINEAIEKGCTIIELTPEEKQLFMDALKDFNLTEGAEYADILNAIDEMK